MEQMNRRVLEVNRINLCFKLRYKCYLLGFYCTLTERLALGIRDHLFACLLRSVVSHRMTPLLVLNLDGFILKRQDCCGKTIYLCYLQEWLKILAAINRPSTLIFDIKFRVSPIRKKKEEDCSKDDNDVFLLSAYVLFGKTILSKREQMYDEELKEERVRDYLCRGATNEQCLKRISNSISFIVLHK